MRRMAGYATYLMNSQSLSKSFITWTRNLFSFSTVIVRLMEPTAHDKQFKPDHDHSVLSTWVEVEFHDFDATDKCYAHPLTLQYIIQYYGHAPDAKVFHA